MEDAWLHNISTGFPELNTSGRFFDRKHSLHEKEHIEALKNGKNETRSHLGVVHENATQNELKRANTGKQIQGTKAGKSMAITSKAQSHNKENIAVNKNVLVKEKEKEKKPVVVKKPVGVATKPKPPANKAAFVMISNNNDQPTQQTGAENKEENKENLLRKTKSVNDLNKKKTATRPPLEKAKSVDKPTLAPAVKPQLKRPLQAESKLYNYAEIQKKKKEQLAKRLEEEEKSKLKTEFHARPVPKFKPIPIQIKALTKPKVASSDDGAGKKIVKTNSEPQLSVSKKVKSRENLSRVPSILNPDRLRKTNEHLKKLLEKYEPLPVKFKAQNCKVIYKPPFVPKHVDSKPVDAKPFQLQLNNRVEQRKEYDRKLHKTIETRKRQEDFRRKQQEMEDIKELRRKMEFKANPNPFHRY